MTKRDITMDEIVEGMARASYDCEWSPGDYNSKYTPEVERELEKHRANASLSQLLTTANITEAQLIALARGEACVVPAELTEEQAEHMCAAGQICGGIAESVYRAALKARPQ